MLLVFVTLIACILLGWVVFLPGLPLGQWGDLVFLASVCCFMIAIVRLTGLRMQRHLRAAAHEEAKGHVDAAPDDE